MAIDDEQNQPHDDLTGLPSLRSWRAVYFAVFGTFLLWISLLAVLTRAFS